jgi:hypothetical protein
MGATHVLLEPQTTRRSGLVASPPRANVDSLGGKLTRHSGQVHDALALHTVGASRIQGGTVEQHLAVIVPFKTLASRVIQYILKQSVRLVHRSPASRVKQAGPLRRLIVEIDLHGGTAEPVSGRLPDDPEVTAPP